MVANGEMLTRRQETLLAALLAEPTLAAATERAGISETTARRWLQLPAFEAAYRNARRQTVEQALATVQAATAEAVTTLRACLADGMPPNVRVRAATTLLETAVRAVELDDLAARIEELERSMTNLDRSASRPLGEIGGYRGA